MGANLNSLILTAADYKVMLIVPGAGSFPIITADSISWANEREEETIYAIGQEDPIGAKRNATKYSGKIDIQVGEMSAILQSIGIKDTTQISGATLAITAIQGGFSRTYSGMNINTESVDISAKDKQSMASLDWTATAIR
jgi:hypothetical protein